MKGALGLLFALLFLAVFTVLWGWDAFMGGMK